MRYLSEEIRERLRKTNKVLLADMRSPVQFSHGSIEGATNLPLRNFVNKISGMDRNVNLVLFSDDVNDSEIQSGVRYAEQLGYTKIYVSDYQNIKRWF